MSSSPTTPTSPGSPSSTTGIERARIGKRLLAYRVMAYICGVSLLFLCLSMIMNYGFDNEALHWVAIPHGWLYVIYLVTVLLLGTAVRWSPGRVVLVMLAGTIPLLSFVAERKVTAQVRGAVG